ncbi:hypothetical protein [Fontivita pretiosa]|uniref:hypothetical protein n=1 Tax=Fontivita pretiosa TaxID=2989684 RepID=UPI003D163EBF
MIWTAVATLLCGVGAVALAGWIMVRGTPEWYRPGSLTAEQREELAQRAERKLVGVQNEVARARAAEYAAQHHNSTRPATSAGQPFVISFTDDEINAFFDKWSVWQNVKQSYSKFLTDPRIVLREGRMILAGRLNDVDAIASLHFEPRITPDGRLDLRLVRVLAGKLPLPAGVLDKYRDRSSRALMQRMSRWRQNASIDSTGIANANAISAAMGQVLIDVLHNRPADAVLFLPVIDHGSIPVRLIDVRIEDNSITLTADPMNAAERGRLLQSIRTGSPLAAGGG